MENQAFSLIFQEHNRMITTYLHALVGDWTEAADLAQDTFVIAYRRMDTYDPARSVAVWLRGIARNVARNALRKKRRERIFMVDGNVIEETFAAMDERDDLACWDEKLLALDRCVEKLPESQRKAVQSYYESGQSTSTVAAMLGILERSVYQLLWQARKNLKKCVELIAPAERRENHG